MFVDGPDPGEEPEDFGVPTEKVDQLVTDIAEALRKIGLYMESTAVVLVGEDEDAHKYGVRSVVTDEKPMVIMGSATIGDLAWKRLKTDDEAINDQLIRMEHGIVEDEVEELRKKYGNPSE